jgi:hypothetical protein
VHEGRARPQLRAESRVSRTRPVYNGKMSTEVSYKAPHAHSDYRRYLQEELERRMQINRLYSMRAFAKHLGVESSWLSKLLRGDRRITTGFIQRTGMRLGLDLSEIRQFMEESRLHSGPILPPRHFNQIENDSFEFISDWHHFAILELMKTAGFKQEKDWISQRLKMAPDEVDDAIRRLISIGVITVDSSGQWVDSSGGFTTHNLSPYSTSTGRRKLQAQLLKKSQKCLEDLPIEKRDHSSMMMACSAARIDGAKKLIDEFRYKLSAYLETGEKDTVFALQVSMFPLSSNYGED